MKQTTLKRDEEQVQAIVNNLSETMTDSFDIEDHLPCLMNISTGMHATKKYRILCCLLSTKMEKKYRNGIGPTGYERMLSIMTSSLLLAKTRARLKTISGLI
jgi:hypothetical protein